jgi:predicted O-methyltransferase YrrM
MSSSSLLQPRDPVARHLRVAAPFPLAAGHVELSLIASAEDAPGQPDMALMKLALGAAADALDVDFSALRPRSDAAARWLSVYPGEHYQLLAALVRRVTPRTVVEIGTYTGLSALAMLTALPAASTITTFDIVPWADLGDTALRYDDFADGRLVQVLANLSVDAQFRRHADLLCAASLIFVDGPKDGRFEPTFYRLLRGLRRETSCLVVFDDIRVWPMLGFWRSIDQPKIDLTSFGHWSGTGLVRLPAG